MTNPGPHLSMLAIDDELSIQLILQHFFKDDFSVQTKGNGKEALAWIQEGNIPDIIVADINMPEMDGFTFIHHIRSSGFMRNIPMVILSGSDSTENKIRCLESGADDFIVKPFNPRELAARVNGILRRNGKNNGKLEIMTNQRGKVAVVTSLPAIAGQIKVALNDLFDIDVYKNGLALHHTMNKAISYKAIISDDELLGINGIALLKVLNSFGFGKIPFILLLSTLSNEQRRLAMSENIADIFLKPIDENALRLRIPYLIENFNNKASTQIDAPGYKLPFIKRLFDITFSGLALLMLSPVFLIIAALIRIESKGPVFYYSLRVGSGYKVFKFFKFRSMFTGADARLKDLSHLNQYNDAKVVTIPTNTVVKVLCDFCEQEGTGCAHPLYADNKVVCETLYNQQKESNVDSAFIKIKNDPRITRVGNFIRNMSIDELPQLWNVFIGDMSIVGNRPLPLHEAEKITTDKYSLRFMAPAGITGLWQVKKRGRGEMSESERLNLDNNYAKTHSFANDIRLILRTIPALFQSENV